MAWYNFWRNKQTALPAAQEQTSSSYRGNWIPANPIRREVYDGEKTPGELGYIRDSIPYYQGLRYRAYDADLKKDIVKIITGKFFKWVIGNGLKLQAEPAVDVLKSEGITLASPEDFRSAVEARFSIFAASKYSDHRFLESLHARAADAFKTAFLGGDCLCVMRIASKGNLTLEVIDGEHVSTPFLDKSLMDAVKARGNEVRHGIEIDELGRHIAFFILSRDEKNPLGKWTRVPARGAQSGKELAWMQYGDKHRIDHVRGIPAITQILEKIDKLDRYSEAIVGGAEERAKIAYAIEHSRDSDGENPLLNKAKLAAGLGQGSAAETTGYVEGEKTAAIIAATTQKQTFNLPIGAKLTALDSSLTLEYAPFYKTIFQFLCASVDIPPEVALQMYEQNYSSSRAAIKGWEYIVKLHRERFAAKFYQKFYALWLELEILNNKVAAPGFLKALQADNYMALEAYSKARFVGPNMPHIDPLKEVNSVRAILGKNNDDPLASREQAAEMLGLGDWYSNNEKYKEESKEVEKDESSNIPESQPGARVERQQEV